MLNVLRILLLQICGGDGSLLRSIELGPRVSSVAGAYFCISSLVLTCVTSLPPAKIVYCCQVWRGFLLFRLGKPEPAKEALRSVLSSTEENSTNPELRFSRTEAEEGIRNIENYCKSMNEYKRFMLEGKHRDALQCSVTLLCVPCRDTHLCHVRALCALHEFEACKTHVDRMMQDTVSTELQPYAHCSAVFPVPSPDTMGWCMRDNTFVCDIHATVQYLLCMGPELGALYFGVLKNIVMIEHGRSVLLELLKILSGKSAIFCYSFL